MIFPKPDEYDAAVQNPKICFSDDELRNGRVEENSMGLPHAYSGGFTTTYQVFTDNTTYAARCFIKDVSNLVGRYEAIDAFLKRTKCVYLVYAEVLNKGILVAGKWHPIIKMNWVKGDLLDKYVEKLLKSGKADLEEFQKKFEAFAHQLENDEFAHGDLQHGNVLIKNDKIYLIDYDGIYLPEIESLGTGEVGHPNFQHPGRTTKFFNRNLDRFSVIVIWLSIKALALKPELWKKYNNGENLIFGIADFRDPRNSELLYKLSQISELAEDASKFASVCHGKFEQIPSLREFIDGNFAHSKVPLKKPAKIASAITSKEQDVFNKLYGAPIQSGVKTASGAFHYVPIQTAGGYTTPAPAASQAPIPQTSYGQAVPQGSSSSTLNPRIGWFKSLLILLAVFCGIIFLASLTDSSSSTTYTNTPTPPVTTPGSLTTTAECPSGQVKSSKNQQCITRAQNCVETEGTGSTWDGNFCTSPCSADQCQLASGTCVSKPANSSCINNATTKYSSWKCDAGYYEGKSTDGEINCYNASSMNSSCSSSQTSSRWDGVDPKGGKLNCVCPTGYVSNDIPFDSPGSACIVPVQKSASELCQGKYGANTYSDGTYCQCNTGYEWNSSQTACVVQITANARNQSCNAQWPNSGWTGKLNDKGGSTCDCITGYSWNSAGTACVIANATQWCRSNNPGYYTDVQEYSTGNFGCLCYGTPAGSPGRTQMGNCRSP